MQTILGIQQQNLRIRIRSFLHTKNLIFKGRLANLFKKTGLKTALFF